MLMTGDTVVSPTRIEAPAGGDDPEAEAER